MAISVDDFFTRYQRPDETLDAPISVDDFFEKYKPSAITHRTANTDFADIYRRAATQYGHPAGFMADWAHMESSQDALAESKDNGYGRGTAKGLFQILDATAAELGITDQLDPEQSAFGGAKYLRQHIDAFGGDIEKGIASYHSGAGNVRVAVRKGGESWIDQLGPAGQAYVKQLAPKYFDAQQNEPVDDSFSAFVTSVSKSIGPRFKRQMAGFMQTMAERPLTPVNRTFYTAEIRKQQKEFRRKFEQQIAESRDKGEIPGQKLFAQASADIAANDYKGTGAKRFAFDVVMGVIEMGPILAVSAVAGPALGITLMSVYVGSGKYGESRAAGRAISDSSLDMVAHGLAEGAMEHIPLGILMKRGGKFLMRIFKASGAEGIQEGLTEILQRGYDIAVIDENMTLGEAIAGLEYWKGVGYAMLVGSAVGGSLATISSPLVRKRKEDDDPDSNPTVTVPGARMFAKQRQADLEGAPKLTAEQQVELDMLRDIQGDAQRIAEAYALKLAPSGLVEQAVDATPELSQEDLDSPLDNDLIQEGHEITQAALGGEKANEILREAGFPDINSRVSVDMDEGLRLATVIDVWEENGITGVNLQFDDGTILSDPFEFLEGRVTVVEKADEEIEAETDTTEEEDQAGETAPEAGVLEPESGEVYTVKTEDKGDISVQVIKRDGGVTLVSSNGVAEYNADFAAGKSIEELLRYSFEPLGYISSSLEVAAEPAVDELEEYRQKARDDFEKMGVSDRDRIPKVAAIRENVSDEAADAYDKTYGDLTDAAVAARVAEDAVAPQVTVTKQADKSKESNLDVYTATDADGKTIGTVYMKPGSSEIADIKVDSDLRGHGVANAILDQIEQQTGTTIVPSDNLTLDGFKMWQRRNPELVKDSNYHFIDDLVGKEFDVPGEGTVKVTDIGTERISVERPDTGIGFALNDEQKKVVLDQVRQDTAKKEPKAVVNKPKVTGPEPDDGLETQPASVYRSSAEGSYLTVLQADSAPYVGSMFVPEEARRQGHARAMVLQAAEDANAKGLDFKSGQLTSKEAQQLWERLDKDGIAEHLPDTEYAVNRYVIRAKKEKPDLAADLANMSDDDIRAAIASAAKPAQAPEDTTFIPSYPLDQPGLAVRDRVQAIAIGDGGAVNYGAEKIWMELSQPERAQLMRVFARDLDDLKLRKVVWNKIPADERTAIESGIHAWIEEADTGTTGEDQEPSPDVVPSTMGTLILHAASLLKNGATGRDVDNDLQNIISIPSENWLSDDESIHQASIDAFLSRVQSVGESGQWKLVGQSKNGLKYAFIYNGDQVEVYKAGKGMGWNLQLRPPEKDWKAANKVKIAEAPDSKDLVTAPEPEGPLRVQWGDRIHAVDSFEDATRKWNQFREATELGASELPRAVILDANDNVVADIAYNGKIKPRAVEADLLPVDDDAVITPWTDPSVTPAEQAAVNMPLSVSGGLPNGITQARMDRIHDLLPKYPKKFNQHPHDSNRWVYNLSSTRQLNFMVVEGKLMLLSVDRDGLGGEFSTSPSQMESKKTTHLKEALELMDQDLRFQDKYQNAPAEEVTHESIEALAAGIKERHGLASFEVEMDIDGQIEVFNIEVPEGNRGVGLGTHAMQELVGYAEANSLQIWLDPTTDDETLSPTEGLHEFYTKLGFEPSDILPGAYVYFPRSYNDVGIDPEPGTLDAAITDDKQAQRVDALRELAEQAGWSEIGGRMIRKTEDVSSPDYSEIVGRTKWLPRADWWPGRPGGFNEQQTADIIEKGINGKFLGKSQKVYFEFLTELADEMIAGRAFQPTEQELGDAGLEPGADSQFEVELVARAIEIDEDAVEQAATQFENDDDGFFQAIKAIVESAPDDQRSQVRTQAQEGQREELTLTPPAGPPAPRDQPRVAVQQDLLGDDTISAQKLANETARLDKARNEGPDGPEQSIESGDPSDLFSQARDQIDLTDAIKAAETLTDAETVYRAAFQKFQPIKEDYQAGNISDDVFLAAQAEFDAALEAREQGDLASQLANMSDDAISKAIADAATQSKAPETDKPEAERSNRTPEGRIRKTRSAPEATDVTDQDAIDRTAGEIAKSIGFNLSSAGKEGLKGLVKLFGGKGKLSSGLSFDEKTYAEAKPHFVAMLADAQAAGHDIIEFINKMVAEFGAGIEPYIIRFAGDLRGSQDDVSQPSDLERDSGDAADQAPEAAGTDEAGSRRTPRGDRSTGGGTGIRGGLAEGDARVLDGGAPTAGERGDQSLHSDEGQRLIEGSPAGSSDNGRSSVAGNLGIPPERSGANESEKSLDRVQQHAAKLKAQKAANKLPVEPGSKSNIDATLPYLFDGQREDVKFTEDRFAKPDGYGVLFTNGTGTGKTYTGLGVVRRYVTQGRKNVLIIAPTAKIIGDWVQAGKDLGLDITRLDDTQDAGTGVVITTYANMYQNDALVTRDWDLVVADEAQYLMQNAAGTVTANLATLRALTLHPEGVWQRTSMENRELTDELEFLVKIRSSNKTAAQNERQTALYRELDEKRNVIQEYVDARQLEKRPRAMFLSATPFAYEKTIDWANGYLFDYNEGKPRDESRGYNTGDNRDQFYMEHFGYRMRVGRLTTPDVMVDSGLMQRQFNTWLKKQKVLSNSTLDVPFDYDRLFILMDSNIGNRVDELIEWLHGTDSDSKSVAGIKRTMSEIVDDHFDHLSRRYFLEAIKAEASVKIVKEHMALGRKVLVFHDFKKGGGFNPFAMNAAVIREGWLPLGVEQNDVSGVVSDYNERFKDVLSTEFQNMRSPINTYRAEFPDVLLYNGDVPARVRSKNADIFNDDATGAQVMLAQSAAGKEGISLHDTTGKHQRVILNLGLPTQPTTAIQQEGRIYRIGQASHAMFRYLNTGTNWEKWAFATTIAQRASAAENLAQGEQARALKDAFIAGFQESDTYPAGFEGEGTGGKERDRAANNALTEFDRAIAFYYGTAKKSASTRAAEGVDYFATPEPLGFKMMEWAGIQPGEKVLEPSAGHGAIARWAPSTANVTAIEPSGELSSRLAMVFDGEIKRERFEDLHIVNKYDAIVMNPPFGSGGKTAIDHLNKAVTHLREGGRVIAIIPQGPAADKKFDKWYEEVEGVYLVAEIKLPDVTFERAGTKVMARIVVLDKASDPTLVSQGVTHSLGFITNINEFFDGIMDMELPARPKLPQTTAVTSTTSVASGTYEALQTVHSKTGADLFVAKIATRLDRDTYLEEKARAKAGGGYYSTFKGQGAIPGFQFKTAQERDDFIEAADGPADEQFSLGPTLPPTSSDMANATNRGPTDIQEARLKRDQRSLDELGAKIQEIDDWMVGSKEMFKAATGYYMGASYPVVDGGKLSFADNNMVASIRRIAFQNKQNPVEYLESTVLLSNAISKAMGRRGQLKRKEIDLAEEIDGRIKRKEDGSEEFSLSSFAANRRAEDRGTTGDMSAVESDLRARLTKVGIADDVILKIVDEILNAKGEVVLAGRGRHVQTAQDQIIEIATGFDGESQMATLNHEIIHVLRSMGLIKDAEWRTLKLAALADQPLIDMIEIRYDRKKLGDDKMLEEAIADMHGRWAAGDLKVNGFIRTAFQRIRDFFEALGNALRGNGFNSAADVFRAIGRGEVGARGQQVVDQTLQPAYSQDLPLGLFSGLLRAARNLKQAKGTAEQMLAMLKKSPGVKKAELDWVGVPEFLRAKDKVTKDELVAFIEANGVQVEEITLGTQGRPLNREERDRLLSYRNISITDMTPDNVDDRRALELRHRAATMPIPTDLEIVDAAGELDIEMDWDDYTETISYFRVAKDGTTGDDIEFEDLPESLQDLINRKTEAESGTDGPIKYADLKYRLPGGEKYREVLLTLPSKSKEGYPKRLTELPEGYHIGTDPSQPDSKRYHVLPPDQAHARPFGGAMNRFATPEQAIDAALRTINFLALDKHRKETDGNDFTDQHFDQPNIIMWLRLNDRTGPNGEKILFIEEAQSAWDKAGRRKGYADISLVPLEEAAHEKMKPLHKDALVILTKNGYLGFDYVGEAVNAVLEHDDFADRWELDTEREVEKLTQFREAHREWRDLKNRLPSESGAVPDQPFKGNAWVELGMKRVIRMASEQGYDQIAWTTGEQQADRYDLSKQVDSIEHKKNGKNYNILVHGTNGDPVLARQAMSIEEVERTLGKEIADKIQNGDGRKVPGQPGTRYLEGDDLKVGGEGMRSFYDRLLPNIFRKITRKLDKSARVGETKIDTGRTAPGKYEIEWNQIGNVWQIRAAGLSEPVGPDYAQEEEAESALRSLEGPPIDVVHALTITDKLRAGAMMGLEQFQRGELPEGLALPGGRRSAAFDPARLARFKAPPDKAQGFIDGEEPLFNGFGDVSETLLDYVRFKLQDKYIDLKRLQEAVPDVSDEMNAYMAEELYHDKAQLAIEEAREQGMKPLIEAIKNAGLTVEEAGEYLYARHAAERNARIAEINPKFEDGGGSGMSDEEAAHILAEYESNDGMEEIARIVDSITRSQRNILVTAGLEREDSVAAWEEMYQNYVPLKGLPGEKEQRIKPGRGQGFDVRGRTKRAFGRRSLANNIIANLLTQYEVTIIRAQKAEVGRALLKFVKANPDSDVWEVNKVEYKPSIDRETGLVVYRPSRSYQMADNVLNVKVEGVDHHITFHGNRGQRIVKSMKNMGAANSSAVIRSFAGINRMLAMVNTSLNPEFIISNLLRDLQTAGINLAGTDADAVKGRILKDVGKAWRGIRRAQKGKEGEWADHYHRFRRAGGKTGWIDAHSDVDRLHKSLLKELKLQETGGSAVGNVVRALGRFIEAENIAVENAVRLSAFVHSTKLGLSEPKAASLAKNLTVNFNRKGEYGVLMNSLYLFYNASVQGNIRMLQALKSPKVRKIVYGIVVFATMLDMLNRMIGGDDEDGMSKYDQIPHWVKERNMIFMNPWSEDGYGKIPLPWGYNIFHVLGQQIGSGISAGMGLNSEFSAAGSAMAVLSATLGSFNPLGSDATLSQFLSPTVLDPIVSLETNTDWAGRKIRPGENPFEKAPSPDSQKYWQSTGEVPKFIAEKLNELTGGSTVRPGAIDVSPTTFEYLYEFATGGAGQFVSNIVDAPLKLIVDGEVDTYRIPFLRKIYGDVGTRATQDRFYENLEQVYYAEKELKLAIETKDSELRRKIRTEHAAYLKSRLHAREAERRLSLLRQKRDSIRARQMTQKQRRSRLLRIEEKMEREMLKFNERIRLLQQRQ